MEGEEEMGAPSTTTPTTRVTFGTELTQLICSSAQGVSGETVSLVRSREEEAGKGKANEL